MREAQENTRKHKALIEVFSAFLKLGLTSFGGPVAHLGYFRTEFVERRRWLNDEQFSQLLAICQFLPGPASSQLGFSLGLIRAGWLGALAAFVAFTLPSALLLVAFAATLPNLSGPVGLATVHGLKLVACAVVADAVLSMSRKLCPDAPRRIFAVFAAAMLLTVSSVWAQLLVVVFSAIAGALLLRGNFPVDSPCGFQVPYDARIRGLLILTFTALLIGLPFFSSDNANLLSVANAFYQAGAFVFGGGHVVLPLLQDSVVVTGWVSPDQFLAGYGASQAIPGPMFAFSAYLGAVLSPEEHSLLTAATALIFIFLPGFLLVAGILPFWCAVSHSLAAQSAIAGVNAAVVGLLGAALYDPIFTSGISGPNDFAIVLVAFAMLVVWRLPSFFVVLWCVLTSVVQVVI